MEQQNSHCKLSKYRKVQSNGTWEFWARQLVFFVTISFFLYACICVSLCVYVCVWGGSIFLCHSQGTWHLCLAGKAREQSLRTYLCLCYWHTQPHLSFYMDTGSLNPDLHVCKASTIIHLDLSPSPQWLFLKYLPKLCKKEDRLKDGLSEDRQREEYRTLYRLYLHPIIRD